MKTILYVVAAIIWIITALATKKYMLISFAVACVMLALMNKK